MTHADSKLTASPLMAMTLCAVLLCSGCSGGAEATANQTSAESQSSFVASAKGRIDIEGGVVRLAARRDGIIDAVYVEEGDRVTAGQLLASLDTTMPRQKLALAESEQRQDKRRMEPLRVRMVAAERELNRLTTLSQKNVIARQEHDKAADELATARAELEALRAGADAAERRAAVARREVEECLVRAPANGQIIQRQARPGNGVSTLNVTPLFLFVPDAPQIVRAELEERFLHLVGPGQTAEVLLEAAPEKRWQAVVLRLGKVVGQRPPSDDPAEKQDHRVVDCVLSINAPELLIGQRVIVRFNKPAGVDPKHPARPAGA